MTGSGFLVRGASYYAIAPRTMEKCDMLIAYLIVISGLCAVYAWYDAPFLFRWYQRLPIALLAFTCSGFYLLVIIFRGVKGAQQKYAAFRDTEHRTSEIAQKYGL